MHRIGRTGRAGASGEAISLVSADETTYLRDIEKLIGIKLPSEVLEGFEPDPNASTEPIKKVQGGGRNRNPRTSNSNRGGNRQRNNRRPKRNNDRRSGGRRD